MAVFLPTCSRATPQSLYWNFDASTLFLSALGTARPGDNAPDETIIGAPGADGKYHGGGSINKADGPHNPFVGLSATFVLSIPNVTSDTLVTRSFFRFGTDASSGFETRFLHVRLHTARCPSCGCPGARTHCPRASRNRPRRRAPACSASDPGKSRWPDVRVSLRGMPVVSRRGALRTLAAIAAGTATGAIAHGYLWERHNLQLVRTDLPMAGLPPAFEGLRVGYISDLHHSEFVGTRRHPARGGVCRGRAAGPRAVRRRLRELRRRPVRRIPAPRRCPCCKHRLVCSPSSAITTTTGRFRMRCAGGV